MDLTDLAALPKDQGQLSTYLEAVRDSFGVDHIAYAGANPVTGQIHGCVTYPDSWKEHYATQGFHNIDPTLHKARRSIAPVDWRRLERDEGFAKVFRNARDFGISERGLTIPIRGPYGDIGMLSITRDCAEPEWDAMKRRIIGDLQSVAVNIHDTVMTSDSLSKMLRYPALSRREIEILQWIAAGKTQQDVGDILGISHRTVEVHLRSARDKLSSLTTPQAVARAISMRLIYPD